MSELITAARPYARAVFEQAEADNAMPQWSDALSVLLELVSIPEMHDALENPALTKQAKAGLLIEAAGDALQPQAQNLVKTMAENGRLILLPEVHALFEQMRAESEGSIEAEVYSAYAVTDAEQQQIADSLKKRLGRDVRLKVEIDESLLGGAIIKAGDLVIDGSIKGRLQQLTSALAR